MKKLASMYNIRKVFKSVLVVILVIFIAFVGYAYFSFAGILTYDIKTDASLSLLSNFNSSKFDSATQRLKKRRGLPDPDPELKNPFGVIKD